MLNQRGFIPIVFIIIGLIVVLSAVAIIRQRDNSQPAKEASSSATVASNSPSPSTKSSTKPSASTASSSPNPSSTTTPNPTSSSNQSNSTPTPTPSSGPSATDGITVLYPNGGETLTASSPLTIRWSAPGMNKVIIRLNKNGNHVLDISNPNDPYVQKDNTGSYTWTPSSQIGGSWLGGGFQFAIEAYSADDPNTRRGPDQSDGQFSINP